MTDERTADERQIKIECENPPASEHSNCLYVQAGDCLYLHFFQIRPPMTMFPPVDDSKNQPVAVAESVASIAVSFDKAQQFIDAMQQQLNFAKIAANAPQAGGRFTYLNRGGEWQHDDHTTDDEVVSGADLAMEDFVVTERDAAEVRHAIASGQARPRFPLPDTAVGIQ